MTTTTLPEPKSKHWTVAQYDRLANLGFFRDERVELIGGRIVRMPPQKEPHLLGVALALRAANKTFRDVEYYVRPSGPVRQGRWSKPEPDVAVVAGNMRDFATRKTPRQALLVIEVSDTTLQYDRGRKASLYAKYGVADYWIVNIGERQLEVHREPVADATHRWGFRYGSIQILTPPTSVSPLAMPTASILVAELLP